MCYVLLTVGGVAQRKYTPAPSRGSDQLAESISGTPIAFQQPSCIRYVCGLQLCLVSVNWMCNWHLLLTRFKLMLLCGLRKRTCAWYSTVYWWKSFWWNMLSGWMNQFLNCTCLSAIVISQTFRISISPAPPKCVGAVDVCVSDLCKKEKAFYGKMCDGTDTAFLIHPSCCEGAKHDVF